MPKSLKRHQQLRCTRIRYVCVFCHKGFNLKATLKMHKRTKHNDHTEDKNNVQHNIEGLSVGSAEEALALDFDELSRQQNVQQGEKVQENRNTSAQVNTTFESDRQNKSKLSGGESTRLIEVLMNSVTL